MDLLAAVLDRLPFIMSDLVVYGSMALTSAAIYLLAFFGIVGSFYRSSSSLGPPTRALAAAWALLVPTAAVFSGLAVAAARHNLGDFSTGGMLMEAAAGRDESRANQLSPVCCPPQLPPLRVQRACWRRCWARRSCCGLPPWRSPLPRPSGRPTCRQSLHPPLPRWRRRSRRWWQSRQAAAAREASALLRGPL